MFATDEHEVYTLTQFVSGSKFDNANTYLFDGQFAFYFYFWNKIATGNDAYSDQ
jgi:hypothetical protein